MFQIIGKQLLVSLLSMGAFQCGWGQYFYSRPHYTRPSNNTSHNFNFGVNLGLDETSSKRNFYLGIPANKGKQFKYYFGTYSIADSYENISTGDSSQNSTDFELGMLKPFKYKHHSTHLALISILENYTINLKDSFGNLRAIKTQDFGLAFQTGISYFNRNFEIGLSTQTQIYTRISGQKSITSEKSEEFKIFKEERELRISQIHIEGNLFMKYKITDNGYIHLALLAPTSSNTFTEIPLPKSLKFVMGMQWAI